ncbi:MAG: non-homologous end-joining DNA ligase [Bacteroidota bacterium]
MSLATYRKKRNFRDTPEPPGKINKTLTRLTFVVQRHHASHLHYDFRLELNGVLKSWAIPKGPPMDPADKRLAVMVEDHPLSYAKFEGIIPEGNYGAGKVEIWDSGTYEPLATTSPTGAQRSIPEQLRHGTFKFVLHGKKLKGSFALIRLKNGKGKNWLLIKSKDHPDSKVKTTGRASKKSEKKMLKPKAKSPTGNERYVKMKGHLLRLTHIDKIYFPSDHITKGDVIDYYNSIHRYILPHLKGRPQSLKRNPNGIEEAAFYHKDAGGQAPDWVKTIKIESETADKNIEYIVCNDLLTLLYMNNLGCIEINPWHSRIKSLEYPDYLVIDLDPSERNSFDEVVEAALVINQILNQGDVSSYCKTSGATGLHIYIPLHATYPYDQVRYFAEFIVRMAESQLHHLATTERALNKRKGRIYLDYMQNSRGQTLAAVYSLRPKVGGTVSTPLLWKEVKAGLHPSQFTLRNVLRRVDKIGDLFQPVLKEKTNIHRCLKKLGSAGLLKGLF